MLNNLNIILLFSDFYNILSINWLLLIRKHYEVILIFFRIVLRNSLDPDSDFWLDPNSNKLDSKHRLWGVSLVRPFYFWWMQMKARRIFTAVKFFKVMAPHQICFLGIEKKLVTRVSRILAIISPPVVCTFCVLYLLQLHLNVSSWTRIPDIRRL